MTRKEIDALWFEAMHQSISAGEDFIRYHFAALVAAAEREECAAFLESGVDLAGLAGDPMMQAFTGKLLIGCAKAIRARGEK